MQVRGALLSQGTPVVSTPINNDIETAIQLRMLTERLYTLFEDAHKKGLGLLLPVAFRTYHENNMAGKVPPNFIDLITELAGQELFDFEHATRLVFGDEPEPDIDEPKDIDEDETCPF